MSPGAPACAKPRLLWPGKVFQPASPHRTSMGIRILGTCLGLLALLPVASRAQETPEPGGFNLKGKRMQFDTTRNVFTFIDSVVLQYRGITVRSERAERHGSNEDYHVFFHKDVRIRDRGVFMTGDEGEFAQRENYAELRGNVAIRDSSGVIHASRVRYYRDPRLLRLWGDVDFQDEKTRVLADSVRYEQETGLGEAFGHVVIIDRERDSEARGAHGFYDRTKGEAWIDQEPILVLRDENGVETFVYADNDARYNPERRTVWVRGHVRIVRGNTVAEADSARVLEEREMLELRGNPRVRQGPSRISGGEIDIHFGGGEIQDVHVRRRAMLVQERADTLLIPDANLVAGDSAVVSFDGGELQQAIVLGRGHSIYVPAEAGDRISLNEAEADSIVMLFAADEMQEVLFVGNASGTYRFYEGPLDSLRQRHHAEVDTTFGVVRADTTGFDFRSQADLVEYSAERIIYMAPYNDMHMEGSAEVDYQGRTLKAGEITFDADTELLTATQDPLLLEGSERVYGDRMGYDMEKREASIVDGATQYDQGYYKGERILRASDGTLQVVNGRYTSCDLETPHYSFRTKQMKIYLRDKAVGRPVYVYLGKIPIFYLPFFFNSVDPGRKSGFLMPDVEFGIGTNSRYIRGLDYYWAASPYWDILFNTAYNERDRLNHSLVPSESQAGQSRNIQLGANLRYKVRYHLDGNLEYRRSDDIDSDAHFVTMRGSHRQTISDNMTLNGTLDYASSDQALRATNEFVDYDRARQRQLTSSLTFNRRGGLASTTVSLQRRQILNPDESIVNQAVVSQTLPSFSVRFRSIRLAPRPLGDGAAWQKFLSELQFAPNLSVTRNADEVRRQRLLHSETGEVLPDTTTVPDSLITKEFYTENVERLSAASSLSLGRQSSLWIFTMTPSISYSASYLDDERTPSTLSERFTHSFSAGISNFSTQFFGIFRPHIGSLRALRHTIQPTASYSYSAGLSGRSSSQGVSLSLRNILDAKVGVAGEEGKETEKRLDGLLEWALSTSYSPDRQREWSNISSRVTLNRNGPLRLTVTQSIDPYRRKIVSTSVPFTLRLAGTFSQSEAPQEEQELNRIVREEGSKAAPEDSLSPTSNWGFSPSPEDGLETVERAKNVPPGERLTWELAFSYSLNRQEGRNLSKNVAIGAALRPTRKWTLRWRANYDTSTRELINPSFEVERDLHCWRASFSRVFNAFDDEWRYYFRIYVIRHQDELFLESGDRGFGR